MNSPPESLFWLCSSCICICWKSRLNLKLNCLTVERCFSNQHIVYLHRRNQLSAAKQCCVSAGLEVWKKKRKKKHSQSLILSNFPAKVSKKTWRKTYVLYLRSSILKKTVFVLYVFCLEQIFPLVLGGKVRRKNASKLNVSDCILLWGFLNNL